MIIGSDHSWYDWTVQNADKSFSYHAIDFAHAYANGVRFTFLKACSGTSDTRFYPLAMLAARQAGLLAAPYVWLYEGMAAQQAEFWYSRLKDEPVIWIDFESYLTSVPKAHDLFEAIDRLRTLGYAGTIGIYTGHFYWLANGNAAPYWKQFPVCLARYQSTQPPQLTLPWDDHAPINCDFWQWSATGDPSFYGVTNGKKVVDEQKFDGTQAELEALYGGFVPPLPPGETMQAHNPAALNLRTSPNSSSNANVIMQMPANTHIEGNEIVTGADGSKWLHTTIPQAGYCASWLLVYETPVVPPALPVLHMTAGADGYETKVFDLNPLP